MKRQDKVFVSVFSGLPGVLVLVAGVFALTGCGPSQDAEDVSKQDPQVQKAIEERIRPEGEVAVAEPASPPAPAPKQEAAAPAPAASAAAASAAPAAGDAGRGKQVFQSACFACHGTGAAGAPKIGDKAAWKDRIAKGMDVLRQRAINGFQGAKGVMPPKGGRMELSDDDVAAAVAYMVSESQ